MKTLILITVTAVLLAACATVQAPLSETTPVAVQNATYVVGENPAAAETMPAAAMGDDLSVVKRVYWYFAGR